MRADELREGDIVLDGSFQRRQILSEPQQASRCIRVYEVTIEQDQPVVAIMMGTGGGSSLALDRRMGVTCLGGPHLPRPSTPEHWSDGPGSAGLQLEGVGSELSSVQCDICPRVG